MNGIAASMYESHAAVSGLNRVPGFDPRKFTRKAISEQTKQEVVYLDLKYKKLWFRLAHPKGRIKKTALKITEQIAIIEAKIYFDKDDAEPVSSFIAQRNAAGSPGSLYIEAAQYAAENQALIDAGFGLQFCDMTQGNDAELLDPGIPGGMAEDNSSNMAPVIEAAQATESAVDLPPAAEVVQAAADTAAHEQDTEITTAAIDTVIQQTVDDEPAPALPADAQPPVQAICEMIGCSQTQDTDAQETATQDVPAYTPDMPVDEIIGLMTHYNAAAVVVDTGTCKGWTLAEVAEKRPASLMWYLKGYTGDNNILRAGAKLLHDSVMEKKAS